MFEPKIKPIGPILKKILSFGVIGITLAPFGIYISKPYVNSRLINHEKIHWRQQLEMLIIFFYLWYIIEWAIKSTTGDAYRNLSFEREAYGNEYDETYLVTRKPYAWIKRIFK